MELPPSPWDWEHVINGSENKETIELLKSWRIRIFRILRIIFFFFLLVKIFWMRLPYTPLLKKPDATCTFLEITVIIVNKINVSIHPNECKLQLFPISEEMSSFFSFARFWEDFGNFSRFTITSVRVISPYCDVKVHVG